MSANHHVHVLVVDDEDDIREILGSVLRYRGLDVSLARDGIEALAEVHRERPDLILLDLMMPRLSGPDFMQELRKDKACARIPIIIISGDVYAREIARASGAAGCLIKPVEISALMHLVHVALRTSSDSTSVGQDARQR